MRDLRARARSLNLLHDLALAIAAGWDSDREARAGKKDPFIIHKQSPAAEPDARFSADSTAILCSDKYPLFFVPFTGECGPDLIAQKRLEYVHPAWGCL